MPKGRGAQHQTLQIMMADGSMETDSHAQKVGSQLLSDLMHGIAMPGREMPTPTYVHKESNRAPQQQDGVHFETVSPIAVEFDSQFLNSDAWAMWDRARLDLDTEQDSARRRNAWLQGLFCVVCGAVLIFSLFMLGAGAKDSSEAETGGGQQAGPTQPAPTLQPILPPRIGG